MAVNGNGYLDFLDQSQSKVKGQFARPVKLLNQRNEWIRYARFQESNLDTCEEFVIQTGLPDAYYVTVGKGVPISKATHAKIQEGWAIIEQACEVPRHLVRGSDLEQTLMQQREAGFESVMQKGSQGLIYANGSLNDDQFNGAAVRLSSLSAGNAAQIFSCGGSTANAQTSVYAFKWQEGGCYIITPPGMTAGLSSEDMGLQSRLDSVNGGYVDVFRHVVNMGIGLAVPDWRCLGRICNIDVASLRAISGTQAPTAATNILHGFLYLIGRMSRMGPSKIMFAANLDVFTALHRIGMEKSNAAVEVQQAASQFGQPGEVSVTVWGHPVVLMDQILNTEAVVS